MDASDLYKPHLKAVANDYDSFEPISKERPFELSKILLELLAVKDKQTYHHSNRVSTLTKEWAMYMRSRWQWTTFDLEELQTAALLHDIGKVGVLDEVLLKESSLTTAERESMEQHSEIGYQMVRDYPGISEIAMGVRHHHERWDGKGYPLGLKGKQIPLFAQIIGLVDTYDAIVSDRPYRKARSHEVALVEIQAEAGRQFSAELVETFLQFMHARNQ